MSNAFTTTSRLYYFDPAGPVRDITYLDPASNVGEEASWGGLLDFRARANQTVAKGVANSTEAITGDLFAAPKWKPNCAGCSIG